jgi:hypothetical protein
MSCLQAAPSAPTDSPIVNNICMSYLPSGLCRCCVFCSTDSRHGSKLPCTWALTPACIVPPSNTESMITSACVRGLDIPALLLQVSCSHLGQQLPESGMLETGVEASRESMPTPIGHQWRSFCPGVLPLLPRCHYSSRCIMSPTPPLCPRWYVISW